MEVLGQHGLHRKTLSETKIKTSKNEIALDIQDGISCQWLSFLSTWITAEYSCVVHFRLI